MKSSIEKHKKYISETFKINTTSCNTFNDLAKDERSYEISNSYDPPYGKEKKDSYRKLPRDEIFCEEDRLIQIPRVKVHINIVNKIIKRTKKINEYWIKMLNEHINLFF